MAGRNAIGMHFLWQASHTETQFYWVCIVKTSVELRPERCRGEIMLCGLLNRILSAWDKKRTVPSSHLQIGAFPGSSGLIMFPGDNLSTWRRKPHEKNNIILQTFISKYSYGWRLYKKLYSLILVFIVMLWICEFV
jgi:hypothetical protein